MADIREETLKRLEAIAAGVQGIAAVARNKTDVPGLHRPAVLIQDGADNFASAPRSEQYMRVQLMELSPQIWVKVKTSEEEAGPLLSRLRNRLLIAIAEDATLRTILTTNGYIRFEGSSRPEPTPEGQEQRMDLNIVFGYPHRLVDLV